MNFDIIDRKFMNFLQTTKGKKLKVLSIIVLILAIFLSQLFFNFLTLKRGDDYSYAFSWADRYEKMTEFSQLVPSILEHYQVLNGRSVDHFIAQFFIILDNNGYGAIFDVCNSFAYLALLFLMYYHSKGTFKNFKLWWLGAIHLCLWIFVPAYADCFLWLTGSCNYCWSTVIVLLFMVPFTHYSFNDNPKKSNIFIKIFLSLLYIPFGVIAGNANENTGVAIVVMIILFAVKAKLEKKKLPLWMFTGLIGVLVGFIYLLVSPGQHARAERVGGFGGIGTWINRAVFITFDVFEVLAVPLMILFVALILAFVSNKKLKLSSFYSFLIPLIGSGSAIYCMMVSPEFPTRSWTPPIVFAIIAFGQLLSLIKPTDKIYRRTVCALLAFATICFGTSYITSYLDIKQTVIAFNEREAYIAEQKAKGETVLVLKPVRGWAKYNIISSGGDLTSESDEWPNNYIARYYSVEKVINSESREGIMYDIFE